MLFQFNVFFSFARILRSCQQSGSTIVHCFREQNIMIFFADAIMVSHNLLGIIALRRVKQQILLIVLYCKNVSAYIKSQCGIAL